MLLKLGPLAVSVAGSIGGMTVQRGATGATARAKPIPTQRQLRAGSTARQVLASAVRAWGGLSPAQREAWDEFAANVPWFNRFGDPVAGTGYRAFMRINSAAYLSRHEAALVPPLLDPPSTWASVLPAGLAVQQKQGSNDLSVVSIDPTVDADTELAVFAGAPQSPGRRSPANWLRFLCMVKPGESLPFNLSPAYDDVFGKLPNHVIEQQASFRILALSYPDRWPGVQAILPLIWVP